MFTYTIVDLLLSLIRNWSCLTFMSNPLYCVIRLGLFIINQLSLLVSLRLCYICMCICMYTYHVEILFSMYMTSE